MKWSGDKNGDEKSCMIFLLIDLSCIFLGVGGQRHMHIGVA